MACLTPLPASPFLNIQKLPDHGALDAVQAALDDALSEIQTADPELSADEIEPILKAIYRLAA